jgi:hypothetical protein
VQGLVFVAHSLYIYTLIFRNDPRCPGDGLIRVITDLENGGDML